MDVPRVIPCMPGAKLVETVDDSNWKADMNVKLGPISLTFATDVHARRRRTRPAGVVTLSREGAREAGPRRSAGPIESSLTTCSTAARASTSSPT